MQIPTTVILTPPRDCTGCLQSIKWKSLKLLELKWQTEESPASSANLGNTDHHTPSWPAEAQHSCPRCIPDKVLLT